MSSQTGPDTPQSWDAASQGYAKEVAPVLMESFAQGLIDRLEVDPNSEVVEVGAGSGALTQALTGQVKSVLAVDFSPKMIELLRNRMRNLGAGNVRCEVMDGQALEIEDASFDRAASSFALMLFPDRAKGFSELRRVLRPCGRAVVSGWTGPEKFQIFGVFLEAMKAAFPEMPPPAAPPPVFSLANPESFKIEMEAGGFREVRVEFVSRDMQISGFEQLWAALTAGAPPVQMLFDRVGPQGQQRLRDVLAGIVERRFGRGPIHLTNTATFGWGKVN